MLLSQLWPKGQKMRPKVAELGQNEAKFADLKFHTLFSQKKTDTRQNGVGNSRLLYRLNVVTCLLHDIFFAH